METKQDLQAANKNKLYRGEVVYVYVFDLAYDMKGMPTETLLSLPIQDYSAGQSKRSPKNAFFYRPRMIVLPGETKHGPHGEIKIRKSVKLFSVGAISIKVCVPFEVESLQELVSYHDTSFAAGSRLEDEVYKLAENILRELIPYCIRPVTNLTQDEAYTIFCIYELPHSTDGENICADDWLTTNRREVAGLLTEEQDSTQLSEQEVEESTEQYLSYYNSDLVVVDWDAALVVGKEENLDDVLHTMEMANVQLAELEVYDHILDESLEMAYRDVARGRMPARRNIYRNLREINVDLARLSDELLNTTKFFGDWYLAKIFENLAGRFHLGDWHGSIDEKLKTLGDLYQILQQDRVNLWMIILEVTIVLLFIIDVIILLMPVK